MKAKRIAFLICTVILTAILCVMLTSCLKIGMREKNVVDRLNNAGVSVQYERTSPMTVEGQSGYKIGDIVHGTMTVTENTEGEDVDREEHIYVFFANDIRSADWVEKMCKNYIDENSASLSHWNVYRFEEVVAVGYYKLVSIVRQY